MMRYKVFQTKEGIRVVSEYCKDIKGVIFQLNFYAGALNDPKGKAGLAHFCEHALMSFSTKNHTRKERNDNLKKYHYYNAYTSRFGSGFFIMTTPDKIDSAVDCLTEGFSDLQYTQENFDLEYKIISDEINTIKLQNSMLCQWAYHKNFTKNKEYKNFRYSFAGDIQSLQNIKLKDVKDFIEKYYNTNNVTVNVVGNISPKEIEKLISKYVYPRLNKGGEQGFKIKNHLGYKPSGFVFEKAVEPNQGFIQIEYKIIDFVAKENYNRDWYLENRIISHILYNYSTTYFRTKKGLCYSCDCSINQKSDGIYLKFSIACQEDNMLKVIEEYPAFIKGMVENFTQESFQNAKDIYASSINFDYNDLMGRASSNYRQYDVFGYLLGDKEAKHDEEFIKNYSYDEALERVEQIANKKPAMVIVSNNDFSNFDFKEFCKKIIVK